MEDNFKENTRSLVISNEKKNEKAIKSMKNGKVAGSGDLCLELSTVV